VPHSFCLHQSECLLSRKSGKTALHEKRNVKLNIRVDAESTLPLSLIRYKTIKLSDPSTNNTIGPFEICKRLSCGASCRGDTGDRPRKLPDVAELKGAKDIFERSKAPAWDWKVGMQAHRLTWTT
jgi:hypothetical protein